MVKPLQYKSSGINANQRRVSQVADKWLHSSMTISQKKEELNKIETVLCVAMIKLYKNHPHLIEDPDQLQQKDLVFNRKQLLRKLSGSNHWGELFPAAFYRLPTKLPSPESLVDSKFGSSQHSEFLIMGKHQMLGIVIESKKRFITQYKNEDRDGIKYMPILLCLHQPSALAVIFELPSLKFLTTYALD